MNATLYAYTLADHWLPALINGDETGLSDSDSAELSDFLASLPEGSGHWSCDDTESHFARDEVSGLHAMCVDCVYVVMR